MWKYVQKKEIISFLPIQWWALRFAFFEWDLIVTKQTSTRIPPQGIITVKKTNQILGTGKQEVHMITPPYSPWWPSQAWAV